MKKAPRFIHIFAFAESRKVAFGMWLFVVACAFLWFGKITSNEWFKCTVISGLLIGFGTILDHALEKFAEKYVGTTVTVVQTIPSPQP